MPMPHDPPRLKRKAYMPRSSISGYNPVIAAINLQDARAFCNALNRRHAIYSVTRASGEPQVNQSPDILTNCRRAHAYDHWAATQMDDAEIQQRTLDNRASEEADHLPNPLPMSRLRNLKIFCSICYIPIESFSIHHDQAAHSVDISCHCHGQHAHVSFSELQIAPLTRPGASLSLFQDASE